MSMYLGDRVRELKRETESDRVRIERERESEKRECEK